MAEQQQAYCVKCREKRTMVNPEPVFISNGTPATKGQCEVCGTNVFRMGATPAHEGIERPKIEKKPRVKKGKRKRGKLVIVESPAKARTVGNFLGKGYMVRASKGHVRDLLKTQLSVDVNNGFEPKYRVPNDKRATIKELKKDVEAASEIFLATDPDREGEAIAWHLIHATEMEDVAIKRVVFHEITDSAVQHAFDHPRSIDMDLVNAQQARRILDRLVGYNITELLWDRVRNRLSAGRVQSIALRLVVDREKEIEVFVPVEYWTLDAELEKQPQNGNKAKPFTARLVKYQGEDVNFNTQADVLPHLDILERSIYVVQDVKHGTRRRRPAAPFTTSTLQQEASRRLGFTAKRTMRNAQQLYEGIDLGKGQGTVGLITYMRTDSTAISEQAQKEAREYVRSRFGKDYVPAKPPIYKTKAKGAQEAHEAIRPTSILREPEMLKDALSRDQMRLYKLIWERFVASQMENAVYNTLRIEIAAGEEHENMPYLFRVSGSTIKFMGFLALYEETRDEDAAIDEDDGRILPEIAVQEVLNLIRLLPEQHFTQPPPRYTEASLVRTLEEYGIGRPSTYAATVAVIQNRDYVEKQDKRLIPSETGRTVNELLVKYFPDILDYEFTARMEDQLDEIAEGDVEWRPFLSDFYGPFEEELKNARENMPQLQQEEYVGRTCPACHEGDLLIKYGRWGKFIGCNNYPDCNHTEPFLQYVGMTCPVCGDEHGGEVVQRRTRRGRTFYGCSRYPDCDYSTWQLPKKENQPVVGEREQAG